jgi:hypothetical protein
VQPPKEDTDPFKEGELPVDLPVTRAVNDGDPENTIKTARLIVIKNSVVANNKMVTVASGAVNISDIIPVGTIDMFIIVNEEGRGWGLDAITVNDTYFSENIEKKILSFSAYPVVDATNQIPMYRQFKGLHVSNSGAFTFEGSPIVDMNKLGEVDRLYAKVTLAVGAVFANTVGKDPIQIDSMSIKSMPKFSYLTPSVGYLYPAAGEYFNGAVSGKTAKYDESTTEVHDTITWYIPESRLSDPANLTYISIKASLADNILPEEQEEYKIAIGDGAFNGVSGYTQAQMFAGNIPMSALFVTRNTHYDVSATITSFSKTNESEIDVITKIIIWEPVKIDDKEVSEYDLNVSQDEFHFTGPGAFRGLITVDTNYPQGWTAAGSEDVKFIDSSGNYVLTNLPLQTGTQLRFESTTSLPDPGYINITAGPIVKKISLIRHYMP